MDKKEERKYNLSGVKAQKKKIKGEARKMTEEEFENLELEKRVRLIQELIPLGLMAVAKELNKEVESLVGSRYQRGADFKRFGYNPGTVRLGGRMVPVKVPRVRGPQGEISLESYRLLHGHSELEEQSILEKILSGVSSRRMEKVLPESVGSIGASSSSVSRKFTQASKKSLKLLKERDLSDFEIVALFIDGTSFSEDQMILALGLDINGNKRVLDFIQAESENSVPIAEMLKVLLSRGLDISSGVLAVIDGSKGIRRGIDEAFKNKVLVQRCQWHKRENIVSYLSKVEQKSMRIRLQKAYNRPSLEEAERALKDILAELSDRNQNANRSLQEGLGETLALHKLNVFHLLGFSLKTTNCIESLNSQLKSYCKNVKRWKNSEQKQRWLATACLESEKGMRKIKGYKHLGKLKIALAKELNLEH